MMLPTVARFVRRKVPVSDGHDDRIEKRYETVEGWLITKVRKICDVWIVKEKSLQKITDSLAHNLTTQKVHAHDECCERVQKAMNAFKIASNESQIPPIKLALSCDTAETRAVELSEDGEEDEEPECSICMEPFAVDEIVSWSPNKVCTHAFHHECIKEWLLRNGNCPFCREVYLPIDEYKQLLEKEELRTLAKARSQRSATSYFCVREGLVSARRSVVGSDNREVINMINQLTHACVKKQELVKLRGSRLEGGKAKTPGDGSGLDPATQVLDQPSYATMEGLIASNFEVVLTSTTASPLSVTSTSRSCCTRN